MTILIDTSTNTVCLTSESLVGLVRTCAEVLDVSEADAETLSPKTKVLVVGGASLDDPDIKITSLSYDPPPRPGHHRRHVTISEHRGAWRVGRSVFLRDTAIMIHPPVIRPDLGAALAYAQRWVAEAPLLTDQPIRLINSTVSETPNQITNAPEGTNNWSYWDYSDHLVMRFFSHQPRYADAGCSSDETWTCYFRDDRGEEQFAPERHVSRAAALAWVRSAPAR